MVEIRRRSHTSALPDPHGEAAPFEAGPAGSSCGAAAARRSSRSPTRRSLGCATSTSACRRSREWTRASTGSSTRSGLGGCVRGRWRDVPADVGAGGAPPRRSAGWPRIVKPRRTGVARPGRRGRPNGRLRGPRPGAAGRGGCGAPGGTGWSRSSRNASNAPRRSTCRSCDAPVAPASGSPIESSSSIRRKAVRRPRSSASTRAAGSAPARSRRPSACAMPRATTAWRTSSSIARRTARSASSR